jgi:heptosyltransferase-2
MNEKILVRGVNWIGDAVMTMPALRALRKAFPKTALSLLVKPHVAAIFERDPTIDEIIPYGTKDSGIMAKLRLAQKLRNMGFSRAFLFQNAFDAAFIAFLARIPVRVGYNRDGRGPLLTQPIPFQDDDRTMHHIRYYLNLLTAAGITAEYSPPWIYLLLEERLSAREMLMPLRRPILGLNPGATYGSSKRWFPERFGEVAGWFIRGTGGSVVIFGSDNEVEIAQEIEKQVSMQQSDLPMSGNGSLINMAGKTSLRELVSLISECDLFLTNDSGPMHISYAVGTPLVALFGSTDPELTGPPKQGNRVIRDSTVCEPCFERTCKQHDMRCMYAIQADDVYLALKEIQPAVPAVFVDRDGTLCEDVNYLNTWEHFRILPGVDDLKKLKARGFKLIGVTNQSGIARGILEDSFVREVNQIFIDRYGFDDFTYCPHHPEEYCACRKPEPGMLHDARYRHRIDLRKSYVIGDKEADMILAKSVGAKGILVRTGQDQESRYADWSVDNLHEALPLVV